MLFKELRCVRNPRGVDWYQYGYDAGVLEGEREICI